MLKERFKEFEERLLKEVKDYYGDRLVSFAVFGSVGRGTQRFDSDMDILIIANGLPNGRMKRVREFDAVEERVEPFLNSLRKEGIETCLSPIIKSPDETEMGSPLFLDMADDARILYDRDGFFKVRLQRLKNRLKELGSKRIWRGNAWYWDLKPDFKPGDVIEL